MLGGADGSLGASKIERARPIALPQPCVSRKALMEFAGGKEPLDDDSVPSNDGGATTMRITMNDKRVIRSLSVTRSLWAMALC